VNHRPTSETGGSDARLVVVWRVTEACNLSCGFCKYDRTREMPRQSATLERAVTLGADLARHARESGREVHVSFLGGEPLLWPPFVEVARLFRRDCGLGTGVTTNGTRLQPRRLEDVDELTVSLDALPPLHDRLRGAPGLFERIASSLAEIARDKRLRRRSGPLLRVNAVLMRETVPGFGALCERLCELGVEEVTFNQLGGADRPEFFPAHRLEAPDLERFAEALPSLRARLAERGLVIRGAPAYLERIAASVRGRRLPVVDCSPGERFLFVDERGIAAPCSFTAEALGRPLCEGGLDAVRSSFGRGLPQAACRDCGSTQVFGKFV
jgi:AdoMet-dependent heme synthase